MGDGWIAEAKLRKSFLHHRMFREAKAKRRGDLRRGNKFVLVTREAGWEALVILILRDFKALVNTPPPLTGGAGLILPGLEADDTEGPE